MIQTTSTTSKTVPINPFTAVGAHRALIDFTRQWGTPWQRKGYSFALATVAFQLAQMRYQRPS